jgi:phosphomannomutase
MMDDTIVKGEQLNRYLEQFDDSIFLFRYAELTAAIFITENIPVYLYSKMTATPFVPFCVARLNALCGVMVTASHNPKEDNGYKVYWTNSAQIIPPHDKNIQSSILQNLV